MNDYIIRDRKRYRDTDIVKVVLPKFREKLEMCKDLFYGYDYGLFITGADLE